MNKNMTFMIIFIKNKKQRNDKVTQLSNMFGRIKIKV